MSEKTLALSIVLCILTLGTIPKTNADLITADWNTVTQGTLGGTSFTYSAPFSVVLLGVDLASDDFSYHPLSSEPVLGVIPQSAITFTFDEPVANLILYASNWQGDTTNPSDPPITYEFSQSFNVLSGFSNALTASNSITIGDSDPSASGVIRFIAPVTTLTITSNYPGDISIDSIRNGILLAVETTPVPLPGAFWLLLPALVGLTRMKRTLSDGS